MSRPLCNGIRYIARNAALRSAKREGEMCKPASFVLTKDRAYWLEKSDSHDEIIEHYSKRLFEPVEGGVEQDAGEGE